MKLLRRPASRGLLLAALLGAMSSGCSATPAAAVAPTIAYEREGQAKALTAATSSRPLVIEWPAAERARLESSSKRGLVVVRYDQATMEVLARCSASGAYAYTPTTPQREAVRIRDEDELRANLPLGAASLASRLARSGELSVDLSVVGTYETAERTPSRADLVGDCDGATHVVVGLTTGAFQFFSGGSADVGASAEAFGADAGGRSSTRRELLSEAGDMAACKTAAPGDAAPPFGCGALLRVEVERLAPVVAVAVAPVTPDPGTPPDATEPAPSEPATTSPPPGPTPPSEEPRPARSSSMPTSGPPPNDPEPGGFWMSPYPLVILFGSLAVLGAAAGIVAATRDESPPIEAAPAGLGKAAVSTPGGASWSF